MLPFKLSRFTVAYADCADAFLRALTRQQNAAVEEVGFTQSNARRSWREGDNKTGSRSSRTFLGVKRISVYVELCGWDDDQDLRTFERQDEFLAALYTFSFPKLCEVIVEVVGSNKPNLLALGLEDSDLEAWEGRIRDRIKGQVDGSVGGH